MYIFEDFNNNVHTNSDIEGTFRVLFFIHHDLKPSNLDVVLCNYRNSFIMWHLTTKLIIADRSLSYLFIVLGLVARCNEMNELLYL